MRQSRHSGAAITHAFLISLLIMVACLTIGAALCTRLIRLGSLREPGPRIPTVTSRLSWLRCSGQQIDSLFSLKWCTAYAWESDRFFNPER